MANISTLTVGGTQYNIKDSSGTYLPLTGGAVTGVSSFPALKITGGRAYNSGDDEGIVIGYAPNGYAGLILGSNTGRRSILYLEGGSSGTAAPRWVYNDGTSSFSIYHPKANGTICLTGHTHGAGDITSGTLSIDRIPTITAAKGGTGQTSLINSANTLLNALDTGSSTPVDADYYISQYVNGGTTTTTYHRRPMSALWSYISGKITKSVITTALGYTPPTTDTNTWRPIGTGATDAAAGNHTHNYAGSNSAGGAAIYVQSADTRNATINPNSLNAATGVRFDFKAKGTISLTDADYSGVMSYRPYASNSDWSGGPAHQLAFNDAGLYWRKSTADTTWSNWYKIYTTGNKPTWDDVTGKPSSFTPASHTHSYLPLSGGTMTGTTIISENSVAVDFRNNASYHTTLSYQTSGNEALVAATKNSVTSFIFVNGEDSITNHATDRWTKLTAATDAGPTPGLQIKQNCVSIGALIPSGTTPTYKLAVAGTLNATGAITQNGTQVSLNGHSHNFITNQGRLTSADNLRGDGCLRFTVATSSMATSKPLFGGKGAAASTADGQILEMPWDNNGGYDVQLAVQNNGSALSIRGGSGKTGNAQNWTDWKPVAMASNAISNITRSGTTFTATRADGTTFTFTQQDTDTNTWRPIGTGATDAAAGNHTHNYAGSSSAGGPANYVTYLHTNEINFAGGKQVTCYFNYRLQSTDAADTSPSAVTYKFCNYTSSTASTTIDAAHFTGNAASATKATQDGNGNNIVNTYANKAYVQSGTTKLVLS